MYMDMGDSTLSLADLSQYVSFVVVTLWWFSRSISNCLCDHSLSLVFWHACMSLAKCIFFSLIFTRYMMQRMMRHSVVNMCSFFYFMWVCIGRMGDRKSQSFAVDLTTDRRRRRIMCTFYRVNNNIFICWPMHLICAMNVQRSESRDHGWWIYVWVIIQVVSSIWNAISN